MKSKKRYYIGSILLVIFLVTVFFLTSSKPVIHQPTVKNGYLDLSGWDFNKQGNVKLDGEWEFYWNRFVEYNEIKTEKVDLLVNVPNTWNEYVLEDDALSGMGVATYRLHIKSQLPIGTVLGMKILSFSSAYKLYINDHIIASNGEVSTVANKEIGEYRPRVAIFDTPSDEFDVIIHVSNHHYARGGFWYSLYLGSPESIIEYNDRVMKKEAMLLGALIIIALFYISIFFLVEEQRYSLYFALLCFSIMFAYDIVGQLFITRLFPQLKFETLILIWYSSSLWLMGSSCLYMSELFETRFSKLVSRTVIIFLIPIQMFYILAPTYYYTHFGRMMNLIELLGYVFAILICIVGIRKGYKNGWISLASVIAVTLAYVHDVLFWTNIITSDCGEILHIGIFIFLLLQMIMQAKRIQQFYAREKYAELKYLQAQIKPHFIHNALNAIISISRYDTEKSRGLLMEFSNYLRRSLDFKTFDNCTLLKTEIEHVQSYVEIERARFEERLEVLFELPDRLDYEVPILVLQPIVENAIVHGVLPKPEGGKVEIRVNIVDQYLEFSVRDNGVGMDFEHNLLDLKEKKGEGIALANINNRLKKSFGKGLEIKKIQGIGTEVKWKIPVNIRSCRCD